MINQTESRQVQRDRLSCEISYKFVDSEKSYIGECVNISGAGISFMGGHRFESGIALELSISTRLPLLTPLKAYVEVIRSKKIAAESYEIATEIKGIREY
ncbi:conserved hypothetical protein [Bathymodiolus platifrons methanotrophic gill symbiont]|uniref:PilZ domain-containing protein n=1 Tax=Bathymodiolus platifrons methanotrophic gill symbiont TaxID=113268 RepID=UPI000B4168D3|nr:PilZ domain-containing protein [Bathymodiolus platifrons methanotrophic gill symbiont]TXK93332.1 pilus assembly protein PilZ [Methylococcaceae bacterium HT1]TXK99472.1 pilus assembly protein PilZ [Methylococcaceae bacterium CS4]TXL00814.1 pilus assembly protein PilZ [Methylococcaceae bacterium CS5]TXL08822.1 pilus assembly protein PilZ [Methylococcaceae bacterium CS1]TXL09017.1 pilus assembly protein PilZ [Methylococcaceae bacterium CS3]TXL11023.1 pilus assembly protein PilZ [Methylococcac